MTSLRNSEHWFQEWFKIHAASFIEFRGIDYTGERGLAEARALFRYLNRGDGRVTPTKEEMYAATSALIENPPRRTTDHALAIKHAILAERRRAAERPAEPFDERRREREARERSARESACKEFDKLTEPERHELMTLEVIMAQEHPEHPGLTDWSRTPPWPEWQAGMLRVMAIMSLEKFQAQTVTA